MAKLFGRYYKLRVQTLPLVFLELSSIAGFRQVDFNFRITRNLSSQPNTSEINIKNLNERHRSELEIMQASTVELDAGYESRHGNIFTGDTRTVDNNKDADTWTTTLAGGDGETSIKEARINKSFPPGTSLITVLSEIAKTMGNTSAPVGMGNTLAMAPLGALLGSGVMFLNGVTVSGPSWKEFNRLCDSAGLEWSIQNGAIQLLKKGTPLPVEAVVLTPLTGLIGSPRMSADGTIFCRSLLNSDIWPGKLLQVVSSGVNATAVANRCDYLGDTAGPDWYIDIEAQRL